MGVPEREPQIGGDILRDETIRHVVVFLVIVTYWPWLTLVVPRAMGML